MPCALCLSNTDLCKSHIIPEFMYKPTYDSKHRAHETMLEPYGQRYLQKGYRQRLLCKECEGRLSKYEAYVKHVWYDQKRLPDEMAQDELVISGLEYTQFKLFHLSVLWRASAATKPPFEKISLGTHEETLRNMILSADPGAEQQYCFTGKALVSDDDLTVLQALFVQPTQTVTPAGVACTFVFGGCEWIYLVESDLKTLFARYFLNKQGTLILRKKAFLHSPVAREFGKALHEAAKTQSKGLAA